MPLSWLVHLSDPEGLRLSEIPPALSRGALGRLLDAAQTHGVLAAAASNLSTAATQGYSELISIGGREEIEAALALKSSVLRVATAFSLLLRAQANTVMKALYAKSIPAFVLKGAHFADRLYNRPALRTFTDVDVMAPPDALADIAAVLAGLGYSRTARGNKKHSADYGQEVWQPDGQSGGLVEIHWDLVNSPVLRKNVSYSFYDVQFEDRPGIFHYMPSAASLLVAASLHAATSHSFDRLLQLYDIRQICLGKAGKIDTQYLVEILDRSGCSASVAISLHLCAKVLKSQQCLDLAHRLSLSMPVAIKALITPSMLQRAPNKTDKLRRKILRELLKRI